MNLHGATVCNIAIAAALAIAAVLAVAVAIGAATGSDAQDKLSALDPKMVDAAATAVSAARLLGNKDFEVNVTNEVLGREVESIISAAQTVGMIELDSEQQASLVAAGMDVAKRSLGLENVTEIQS